MGGCRSESRALKKADRRIGIQLSQKVSNQTAAIVLCLLSLSQRSIKCVKIPMSGDRRPLVRGSDPKTNL